MAVFKPYQVVLNSVVLDQMCRWFSEARPREAYAFLGGKITDKFGYSVESIYMPDTQKSTSSSFIMSEEARVKANMWTARQGCDLLGIVHSHVYHHSAGYWGVLPSINDAKVQQDNHFILSMILTFYKNEDKKALTCWLMGFAAPLEIRIKQGRRLSPLGEYI